MVYEQERVCDGFFRVLSNTAVVVVIYMWHLRMIAEALHFGD